MKFDKTNGYIIVVSHFGCTHSRKDTKYVFDIELKFSFDNNLLNTAIESIELLTKPNVCRVLQNSG